MIFYKEWLSLEKMEFRIMTMLSDKGKFEGNLSNICQYFELTPQSKTRREFRQAIQSLYQKKLITWAQKGRTQILDIKPQTNSLTIEIKNEWYSILRKRGWEEDVSWEAVLKILLWAIQNDYDDIITNNDISAETNLSPTTICSAKKVLNSFEAIHRAKVSIKTPNDSFISIGHHLTGSAFWNK